VKTLILLTAILASTQVANAAPACSAQSFDALKAAVMSQNKIGGAVAMAPAQAYIGLNVAQSNANNSAGTAEAQYLDRVFNRLGVAAKTFIEGDGNIEAAATKALGATNRRLAITIDKRGRAQEAASPKNGCGSGSCLDVSLEVLAMHKVPGKSAQQVMDIISAQKLSTVGAAKVYYCEAGAGCSRRAEIVTSNAKVRQSKNSESMKLNVPYPAREVASSIAGTIDNTSVYKITSFDICGHQAFLMSGVSVKDQNSFSNASQDVLVVEANGKIMSIATAQGIAVKGSSVQSIFLGGLTGGFARATVVDGFNDESKLLGLNEKVDKNGFLK
jgi:hypothetical protein